MNDLDWPHAPPHWLFSPGIYMVTCGTYGKLHHFRDPSRLDSLTKLLIELAGDFGWQLKAWAVLSNHYHFVAQSPEDPKNLPKFLGKLHGQSAREANQLDQAAKRQVWYQYWDSQITFETSYLARLRYVNQNPVHHGVAATAELYPWCSARWFRESASNVFVKTVESFRIDEVNVPDEF